MNDGLGAGTASKAGDPADIRILKRLHLPTGSTGDGEDEVAGIGVVVDVLTTGSMPSTDAVIEMAVRRFSYDRNHNVTRLDRPYVWRQDPGRPLSPDISVMTGIVEADLAGRSIDVGEASRILRTADVRIAHGARFDRPFVDALLPVTAGMPWACSIADVDWASRGLQSARLGWILGHCGYFHDAFGTAGNVDATIQILRHEVQPGVTALSVMMEAASASGWTVRAYGAPYSTRELLKGRGYRWDPDDRVWWREVRDVLPEQAWLTAKIYGGRARGQADFEPADWRSRYA